MKKKDIAAKGQPVAELRVALRRYLLEFQTDLQNLEAIGLDPPVCQAVKEQLREAVAAFEKLSGGPHTVASEIARQFREYEQLYHRWNGPNDAEMTAALRKQLLANMVARRVKLHRSLARRQAELAVDPQLELPFARVIQKAIATVAIKNPNKFPRLRQASMMFDG